MITRHMAGLLLGWAALLTAPVSLTADSDVPDYASKVEPILRAYCVGCHNADDAKGDLDLSAHARLLEGGGSGPVVVAGKSGESSLTLTVERKQKPFMPPKGKPAPSAEEVAVLKRWIDGGAKGPSAAAPFVLTTPKIVPTTPPRLGVNAVAASPVEELVAIARHDVVHLVELPGGLIRHTLSGHVGPVTALVFTKDGKQLVAAAGEPGVFGEARLWSVADGKLVRVFKGHADSLYAVAVSHDGKLLATAGYDKEIHLWEIANGKKGAVLKGHNDAVFGIAFRPDGRLLASASGDRTVKLWDVASGTRLDTFSQSTQDLFAIAFTPDGRRVVAVGADHRLRAWSISESGSEGSNPLLDSVFAHHGAILSVVLSPDGKLLATAADDRIVKIRDAATLAERRVLEKQPDWSPALAFLKDNKRLLVGRQDGSLALYDATTGAKTELQPKAKPPAPPTLTAAWPLGVQRGTTSTVSFTGKDLDHGTIKVSRGDVAAVLKPGEKGGEWRAEVTPAAAAGRGPVELRVETPGGTTGPVTLQVDDLPQLAETEPNNMPPSSGDALPLPVGVWGRIAAKGDEDYFAISLAEGQTVTLDLEASSIGSKLNGTLTLFNEDRQPVAAVNDDGNRSDPLLTFTAPKAGRYLVRVGDLKFDGSTNHFYRLSIGSFPYVTAVFPTSVAARSKATVRLIGYNLGDQAGATFPTKDSGEIIVPLESDRVRFRQPPRVRVSDTAEGIEQEPNDEPGQAKAATLPGSVHGQLGRPGDIDLYRFSAKKGESWIVETEAAQRESPADTRIDVLTSAGQPIERVLLQATRDSNVEFRNINSTGLELRCRHWQEMELNEYMYMAGEVCKLFRAPQGPDSGFNFYSVNGVRLNYFDTSATTHALEDPCYTVQPYPPGTKLVPNGLPTFMLHYQNDDSADRKIGRDSRLTFTAPADGDYLIRVADSRGMGGDRFVYRLTVRPPRPDFRVTVEGMNPTVNAGSGRNLIFSVDRIDNFDGEVTVDVSGLPPGFSIAGPIVIQAGHHQAKSSLVADASAPKPTPANESASRVVARATIGGTPVEHAVGSIGKISLGDAPQLIVRLEPAEVTIPPGGSATCRLKLDRRGFKGVVKFEDMNLPHGVIVANLGLNGITLLEGQTERELFLAARPWVPETRRPFHLVAKAAGDQASPPIMVRVLARDQVATK